MSESCNLIEISKGALRHNFQFCRNLVGRKAILAMVKADGYGHGMVECARLFAELGASAFGVAHVGEGVMLRAAGIREPILIFTSIMPEMIATLLEHDLTPIVADGDLLPVFSQQAEKRGKVLDLHLKVDVGMGRQGCLVAEAPILARRIAELPGLRLAGILAHFPMSDARGHGSTPEIFARFQEQVVAELEKISTTKCILHIANSGAILYFSETRLEMVRPGIMLYGYYPDGPISGEDSATRDLRPAMRFVSRVIQLRRVEAGTGIGYGHTYVTSGATTLALVPVGYANGYLRSLSNRAQILINGQRVPVVGRVSMNLIIADVTALADVQKGDEVVLLGRQGDEEITADEIASWMETISYEVLCLLGNLNRRIYVE